jgi:hypothetical protein
MQVAGGRLDIAAEWALFKFASERRFARNRSRRRVILLPGTIIRLRP